MYLPMVEVQFGFAVELTAPFRYGGPSAHGLEERGVGGLVEVGLGDQLRQFALREIARGVADHPLVIGELVIEEERIGPVEGGGGQEVHLPANFQFWPARWPDHCVMHLEVGDSRGKPYLWLS